MIPITEDRDSLMSSEEVDEIYENLFKLCAELEEMNEFTGVHSVDLDETADGLLNIAFDYKEDVRVMINISPEKIEIIAPENLHEYLTGCIVEEYPEYLDLIEVTE